MALLVISSVNRSQLLLLVKQPDEAMQQHYIKTAVCTRYTYHLLTHCHLVYDVCPLHVQEVHIVDSVTGKCAL